jgi:hypothetical protein
MRLGLHQFLILDGVYQALGGPDEDREGGFGHGGWQTPYRAPAAELHPKRLCRVPGTGLAGPPTQLGAHSGRPGSSLNPYLTREWS